jgi:hypothetical protein
MRRQIDIVGATLLRLELNHGAVLSYGVARAEDEHDRPLHTVPPRVLFSRTHSPSSRSER